MTQAEAITEIQRRVRDATGLAHPTEVVARLLTDIVRWFVAVTGVRVSATSFTTAGPDLTPFPYGLLIDASHEGRRIPITTAERVGRQEEAWRAVEGREPHAVVQLGVDRVWAFPTTEGETVAMQVVPTATIVIDGEDVAFPLPPVYTPTVFALCETLLLLRQRHSRTLKTGIKGIIEMIQQIKESRRVEGARPRRRD